MTREGKSGVVLQQVGTKVVHVYNEARIVPVDYASDGKKSEGGAERRSARSTKAGSVREEADPAPSQDGSLAQLAAGVAPGPSEPTPPDREAIARAVTAELEQMHKDGVPMCMREGETTWRTYHAGFDLSNFAIRISDAILDLLASQHPLFSGAVHINTGIGIDETREFVRQTCRNYQWPLKEYSPPVSYDDIVLEYGFPGPGSHFYMYVRLK